MNPEKLRRVTREFTAKDLGGPFRMNFTTGEIVILLKRAGDNGEFAIFSRLEDVIRCAPESPEPQYEAASDLFGSSTERTRIP